MIGGMGNQNSHDEDQTQVENPDSYIPYAHVQAYTVYVKSFEGENFRGFHEFLLTANVLPLKIFLEYQCRPLSTQNMVPPSLKFSTAKIFPTY